MLRQRGAFVRTGNRQAGIACQAGCVDHRISCCASSSRCTTGAMPTPPALTKDFAYSSVRNDRQICAPGPPLNGPWPTPENICWNMLLRNTASKSWPAALALAALLVTAAALVLPASAALAAEDSVVGDSGEVSSGVITSPRFRPGWRRPP